MYVGMHEHEERKYWAFPEYMAFLGDFHSILHPCAKKPRQHVKIAGFIPIRNRETGAQALKYTLMGTLLKLPTKTSST